MTISGGLNNPNYLLLNHFNNITFSSSNFAIKEIVFHCLDNFLNGNNDVFYWGPTTMNVVPNNTMQGITPGKFIAPYNGNSYDGYWSADFSGTYTSTFVDPTDGITPVTRTHTKYPNGFPVGKQITFMSLGKPIRFSSIDIIIEKESGDIYDLVKNTNELNTTDKYMLVGRLSATTTQGYAMSVNTTGTSSSDNIKSTEVTLLENGEKVKASDETQFIQLQTGTGSNTYKYYIKAGSNYIRSQSALQTSEQYNHGYCLTKLASLPTANYVRTSININQSGENVENWQHYADIRYEFSNSNYAIRHNNDNKHFRNLYDNNSRQRVYLYKPAKSYEVTTEVREHATDGSISLRDGVLLDNNNHYWSQNMETVSFLVNAANGFKIGSLVIQALNTDGTVASTIEPQISSVTTNGTLYTFTMPANDVHIIITFEEVTYHNIYTEVKPNVTYGNIFLTEGYVVQQNQVKSYDGETVVFNVTPNPKDPDNANSELYDLYSVVVTSKTTGEEIPYTYSNGNYTFTMPNDSIIITATFVYENGAPLYLLGTANGGTWQPNGIRFNYDPNEGQYYLDVYFKGVGEYGDTENYDPYGYFSFAWKTSTSWDYNNQNLRGVPMQNNQMVDTSTGGFQLFYNPRNNANESNAFKIPAGIYRFYVKSYNEGNDWLYVTESRLSLTLDPMGGAEAASAVEVPQNQLVTLEGDIYNKIKAINPQEADANFKYKAVKIIGENVTTDEPVASTTTATTTLTEVNDGETVTELHGYNYLGWIVAGDTAFYKVIYTPLKWIEEEGTPGTKYTVGDELIIMHKIDRVGQRLLWAKDQSSSVQDPYNNPTHKDATYKTAEQADYLDATLHVQAPGWGGWDQSNWVMLRFDENTDMTDYHVYQTINAGTLKGTYVDAENFCINVESMETGEDVGYVPNTFCPANFLDFNLNLNDTEGGAVSPSGRKFFFLNPKVQEVADVTLAVWDKTNSRFIMPSGNGANQAGIVGYFTVNCLYNKDGDVIENLVDKTMYSFRGVLNVAPGGSNLAKDAPTGPDATKVVMPFDLNDQSVITAISDVMGSKAVSSVKYYNIMGVESNKPFDGVNIVVTRYSDGTISTTKVLR